MLIVSIAIVLPLVAALAAYVLRPIRGASAAVAVQTVGVQIILAAVVFEPGEYQVLGASFALDATTHLFILSILCFAAFTFVGAVLLGHSYSFFAIGLATLGFALAATIAEPPALAVPFLVGAGLLALFGLGEERLRPRLVVGERKYIVAVTGVGASLMAAFALAETYQVSHDAGIISPLVALLVIGFGLSLAIFPFHFWLPDLAEMAPPMLVALLLGVVGLSAVSLMATVFQAMPWILSSDRVIGLLMGVGATTALLGALLALSQDRLGRIFAYSVVSGTGFVLAGLSTADAVGSMGGVLAALSQGLASLILLFSFASLGSRAKMLTVEEVLARARPTPLMALGLAIGGLTIAGVPPTSGFIARWPVYQVVTERNAWMGLMLVVASALTFLGYLRLFHRLCVEAPVWDVGKGKSLALGGVILVLAGLSIAGGLYPSPVVDVLADALKGV